MRKGNMEVGTHRKIGRPKLAWSDVTGKYLKDKGVKLEEAQAWIPRRVVSAYDVVNASYLPTTINIYDLEIRSINNYRKSYDIASFLVSTKISRRCRFGNLKPCKYIRSSYVRRNCIYDNNRVSANISSYDYR